MPKNSQMLKLMQLLFHYNFKSTKETTLSGNFHKEDSVSLILILAQQLFWSPKLKDINVMVMNS